MHIYQLISDSSTESYGWDFKELIPLDVIQLVGYIGKKILLSLIILK